MCPPDELCSSEAVRQLYGEPSHLSVAKELDRLDPHCRAFIKLSPFLVIASADAEGRCDATPRGDAPGFVRIIDDKNLLIPDRKGNNRVDTLLNIAANPRAGLLFMVPGIDETLRVNGKVTLTTDAALLAPLTVDGKLPKSGILMTIEEVYFQCAKALIRSKLWAPESRVERKSFPSLGQILADQIRAGEAKDGTHLDRLITERYKTGLY